MAQSLKLDMEKDEQRISRLKEFVNTIPLEPRNLSYEEKKRRSYLCG